METPEKGEDKCTDILQSNLREIAVVGSLSEGRHLAADALMS